MQQKLNTKTCYLTSPDLNNFIWIKWECLLSLLKGQYLTSSNLFHIQRISIYL